MNYIGIDLGTSAVKLLLSDENGNILNIVTKEYPVYYPLPKYSEQNPEDWKNAVLCGISELIQNTDKSLVAGIGCGGQMHGLVALDANDSVIRPAILWNDARTEKQVEYLNTVVGKEKLSQYTANIAFAGFTAPKLLWMKENEPELFNKISKIMLPKDYINYILTGVHSSDYSDASGMLLLDVKNKCWSEQMLNICGITKAVMPKLYESYEVTGTIKPDIAKLTGLSNGVKVVAGAGDNAAAAVGTGVISGGRCNISLGTSGTVFIPSAEFCVDSNNALHSFVHANGRFHLMGCMLCAASCNKWFTEDIFNTKDYLFEQQSIDNSLLAKNDVYFLPYLMGERSPLNDTDARGLFIGMSLQTTRQHMLLAVFEGVAFAIRDSFEVAKSLGIEIKQSNICGGGAKSELWKKIIANVLGITLNTVKTEQGPAFGGAILAMVGCKEYNSVETACAKLVKNCESITPDAELREEYNKKYAKYKQIYPAVKGLYKQLIKSEV